MFLHICTYADKESIILPFDFLVSVLFNQRTGLTEEKNCESFGSKDTTVLTLLQISFPRLIKSAASSIFLKGFEACLRPPILSPTMFLRVQKQMIHISPGCH